MDNTGNEDFANLAVDAVVRLKRSRDLQTLQLIKRSLEDVFLE